MDRAPNPGIQLFQRDSWLEPEFFGGHGCNTFGESGIHLNTAPLQGNDARFGGGNGIASWSASRWASVGRPGTFEGQLNAVGNELENRYPGIAAHSQSNASPNSLTATITGSTGHGLPSGYESPGDRTGLTRWGNYGDPNYAGYGGGGNLTAQDRAQDAAQDSGGNVSSGTPSDTQGFGQGSATLPDTAGGGNSLRAMTPEEMAAGDPSAGGGSPMELHPQDQGGRLPGPVKDMGHGGQVSADTPQGTKGFGQAGQGVTSLPDSAMGAPVYLTDQNTVASIAGEKIQKGANELGDKPKDTGKKLGEDVNKAETDLAKVTTADTASVVGQAGGITQYLGNLTYNVLPRAAAIVLGIVIIGGGLFFLGTGNIKK